MHSFTTACSKNAQVCHGFVMQWKGLSKEQNNIALLYKGSSKSS